jgi:hypothetical protein
MIRGGSFRIVAFELNTLYQNISVAINCQHLATVLSQEDSMGRRKTTNVMINVKPEERDYVNELARKRGYKITSDFIRALIEGEAAAAGDDFKFEVNRGGYRERLRDDEREG